MVLWQTDEKLSFSFEADQIDKVAAHIQEAVLLHVRSTNSIWGICSSDLSSAGTDGQNPSTGACELLLIARPCQHLYSLGDTGGSLFLDVNNAFLTVDRSILGIDHIDRAVDRGVLPEAGSGLDQ